MSNYSEVITDVNEADHSALNQFGALVGTIADFSGAIGGTLAAVQFVEGLLGSGPDKTTQLLQDIRDELKQGFDKLGLDIKADELLREWDNLDMITKDAEGIYLTLTATVTDKVDTDEIIRQIGICVTALNALSITAHPEQWLVAHDAQVYFSADRVYQFGGASNSIFNFVPGTADQQTPGLPGSFACQGMTFSDIFDPGSDDAGEVFNFIYTLPAYMKLVVIFLATAAALDPDYTKPDKYASVIRLAAGDLLVLHDLIKAGIVNVVAPDADSMIIPYPCSRTSLYPPNASCLDKGYGQQRSASVYNNTWWHFGWGAGSLITDLSQPYGAVNLYSGYHSVLGYPLLDVPPDVFPGATSSEPGPPETGSDFFVRPVSKYLLRSLARSKEVYIGIGLPAVRQAINRLRSLVGDAPLPGSNFGDWSLREIFDVLGYPRNPFLTPPLSVGKLADYLASSTPFFSASRPISLRQMIDGLPPSIQPLFPI